MASIYRYPSLKKSEKKTFIICGDIHNKDMNQRCWHLLKRFAENECENPSLIINGDLFDFPFLMPKNPDFRRFIKQLHGIEEFFLPQYEEEIAWGNDFLNDAQKTFKEVIFIRGNHDDRVCYFVNDFCPIEYAHHFNLNSSLNLNSRGIKSVPYNSYFDIENLAITHGVYCGAGISPHKKHYMDCGKSVIFSHIHRDDSHCIISREETKKVWSLPSMADLNPDYMRNKPNSWTNGFGVINFYNRRFWVNIFNMWDNEIMLPNGKLL